MANKIEEKKEIFNQKRQEYKDMKDIQDNQNIKDNMDLRRFVDRISKKKEKN